MSPITVSARAKINLHLHITGRMKSGYHTLDTLASFADLADHITIETSGDFRLTLTGDPALLRDCPVDDNLITRSVKALAARYKIPPAVSCHLDKQIPTGAGLGGGSADSAATLKALHKFWGIKDSGEILYEIARSLGSDIAACLQEHATLMQETGNKLVPAPEFPVLHAILVKPQTPCPTPLVYKKYAEFNPDFSSPVTFPDQYKTVKSFCDFMNLHTTNDLTNAAIALNGDVGNILETLNNLPSSLFVRMSGSGSACYAIFNHETEATEYCAQLQKDYPQWWARAIRINEQKSSD